MSEDEDSGTLVRGPWGGDPSYVPPPIPAYSDTIPPPEDIPEAPPESPEETTMELPPVPRPMDPAAALASEGIPAPQPDGEYDEEEGREYIQPRSLADRLGDWLEFRLEVARDRHAGEASFREAEIARKAALMGARTAQEVAMMEQNGKLRRAMMKAKGDKAAAQGKADADRTRSSGSGPGSGKGRPKAGAGGGSSRGGGTNSGGSGRGTGANGSTGGSGRSSGGGNSPKGTGKGSDRSAGGRNSGAKGNAAGGSKGRQNGADGSGSGRGSGSGKGSSGKGSGSSGSGKGGSKGDAGKPPTSPASSPAAERARGRQERAAARQAARQQRRSADQNAGLADRSKDRDQDRANRQALRERRKAKAERAAAGKVKREAAADTDRTTLGAAVAEEAQRRWDKRRTDAKDKADKAEKEGEASQPDTEAKDADVTTEKMPEDGPGPAAGGPKGASATKEPEDGKKSSEKPSDGSDEKDPSGAAGPDDVKDPPGAGDSVGGRSFGERVKDWFNKSGDDAKGTAAPEPEEPPRTVRPEGLGVTVDSPGRPNRPPQPDSPDGEDIPDAVVVDDPADPFRVHVASPAGLPPAPEPHTRRPGTTRPDPHTQENPVTSQVNKTASGQADMEAKHRTDITFGEYLMEIVNIAIAAALDKDRAQDLAVALGNVADALREMAADLIGDHNIATEVTEQVCGLADAATGMKLLAERCATECEVACEAARIAAVAVGRTYGEDIKAMDDAGLAQASAAAHHD
ncbi:ATP/GTP-binding protein [Wenjunlia tyrosinilytica]|uniref:ATP/GTP-binding protein n=1 Tax=Wenjunlia tyrosinilytica TaxID=1544741 RepID=A0A918E294_9ACTN|nr:ATP/GTP-binding protein [Wenjunlia tyrosinilytica]GGO98662.1 ATP/GTP-binding protein [Wenjunlia tyrosinilytica]